MGIWALSTAGLWCMMLLWTCLFKYSFETLLSVLLDTHLEVLIAAHLVVLLITFWGTRIHFSIAVAHFTTPATKHKAARFSISPSALAIFCFVLFCNRHPHGCEGGYLVVLIYIPWWLVMGNIFSCLCWPSVYICVYIYIYLLRNVCFKSFA